MLTTIHPQDYDVFVSLDVDKKSYAISFKESLLSGYKLSNMNWF